MTNNITNKPNKTMKARKTTTALLAVALLAAAVACGETETEYVSAPSLSVSQAVVTISNTGGTGSISYTISNPADDGEVTAAASASWISSVDASASGTVTFTASENTNADPRTGRVTITYSYSVAGTKGTVTAEVTVAQGTGDQPVLEVQPTAVAAALEGGNYSFTYTIINPASDGEIAASCSSTWISNIDDSADGIVTFSVAENEGGLRQASITVTYSYGAGSISDKVTVVQDHPSDATEAETTGTYLATGYAYAGSGVDAYTEWELKIYDYDASISASFPLYDGDFDYYIDGLAPSAEGSYDYYGDHRVSAAAYIDEEGHLCIPTQVMSTTSSGYYVGWTPCTAYSGSGWSYNYGWPDLVFVYNEDEECWESEYGIFMGAFTTMGLVSGTNSGFYSFFDVVSPGMTLVRTGALESLSTENTSTSVKAGKPLDSLELHTELIAE